jgi:hypothetical protein
MSPLGGCLHHSSKGEASMLKLSSGIFLLALVGVYLLFGCGAVTNTAPTPAPTANSFPVVVFSDVHFNPFYDPSLFQELLAKDLSQWESIFQNSTVKTVSAWGSDTNYPLFALALSSIKHNLGASPVVIYTGDLIGHSFPTDFYCLYMTPPHALPCTPGVPTSQDVAAMQAFTDKTVAFVTAQVRASVGNLPVMFAVGNIDSYTGYGPDSTFLANNAGTFYTQFVTGAVDQQTFLSTFTSGGYYSAQPLGSKLTVIGLNTNPFALGVPGDNDSAVAAELSWLDSTLASAQAAGREVWLLMHVPPGANTVATAESIDGNGQIASAAMMMYQSYQTSLLQILAKYPGLITMTLGAHTHMDEYRILSPSVVLDEVPAISPCFGENPAYKIFTLTGNTFTPTDYTSLNYDLAAPPAQFTSYYTFSTTYSMSGPLGASLLQLYPELATNIPLSAAQPPNAQQAAYMVQYNSGNTAWKNPTARPLVPWNAVTKANWPVFACGIGKMAQLDFEDCVNSY